MVIYYIYIYYYIYKENSRKKGSNYHKPDVYS